MSKPSLSYSNFDKLIQSTGNYTRSQLEWYNKFCRFGAIDPYNTLGTTREYIFFTKPDLHIFKNKSVANLNTQLASDPIFIDAKERYLDVLKQLQISNNENKSPFINILSNSVKSTVDLPTITSGEVEGANNIYGDNIPYRWASWTSDNNHEFSLEFEDSKYLEVYMLFKLWDEYVKKKSKGAITPPDESYIFNKILHDQIAVYKIIVGEDGETIIFFAKMWGVFPKKVPREAFSSLDAEGKLTFTVDFNATFVEDSDPTILSEFNLLTKAYSGGPTLSLYDNINKHVDGRWATMPYIVYESNQILNKPCYKLKWRR